jgi:serine/threonine protein kinase
MQAGLKLSRRYALQALLGSGGMGEVWRAVDEQLDRPVAVKVLREDLVDPELAARFRREARIAARLQHPGITVVHDVGSDDGHLFIVMELLHGRDLAAMLAEAPAGLPTDVAVSLAIQAAEALQAAHAAHIVHRDLKPANLFVLNGGRLKICDFGIAWAVDSATHLTATGQAIGTPAYMSPEQCQGQEVDERSDLYSLGCVLYELLTGQPPFTGGQPLSIMLQHLNAAPAAPRTIRPNIPSELDRLVLELLAKDPVRRPADAGYVIAALRPFCYTPTVKVEPFSRRDQESGELPDEPIARSIKASSPLRSVDVEPFRPQENIDSDRFADVKSRFSTVGDTLKTVSGHGSKVLEIEVPPGRYLVRWSKVGKRVLIVSDETEKGAISIIGSHGSSGEKVIHIKKSGPHLLSVTANDLDWSFNFTPI